MTQNELQFEAKWRAVSNLLHIVRKIGKVKVGMSSVCQSCAIRNPYLVIAASDLGDSSMRKIKNCVTRYNKRFLIFASKADYSLLLGRQSAGIIAIEHNELANRIFDLIKSQNDFVTADNESGSVNTGVSTTPTKA